MASLVSYEQRTANIRTDSENVSLQYIRCSPPSRLAPKGTVILLHDYFRTSYQFRYVIDLFAMGGYIAIAPDLLSLSRRSSGSAAMKTIASCLFDFLSKCCTDDRFHLIGCGLGARIASEFVFAHLEMVASLIYSDCASGTQMQQVMELTQSSSRNAVLRAFQADLELQRRGNELISNLDVEEYADAYSHPAAISEMQNLFRSRTESVGITHTGSTSFMQSDPEQQPEDWAISILALLNETNTKPAPRRARL